MSQLLNTHTSTFGASYLVTLPAFEGPLELLLHLIEREELDISEISLVAVTDQYLQTLELLEELQPGALADFLVIASRLLFIKSRRLLPRHQPADSEEEDQGDALIRQLLEYRQFKQIANSLQEREESGLRVYVRMAPRPQLERRLDMSNVDLEKLQRALKRALQRIPSDPPMPTVRAYPITVAEQIENVRGYLQEVRRLNQANGDTNGEATSVPFMGLLSRQPTRLEVIVTFLAVLELIKLQELDVVQEDIFGEILLLPVGLE